MSAPSIFQRMVKAFGPFLLGFGTVFQPKAHRDDHWSKSPKIEIVVEKAVEGTGEPADIEDETGEPSRTTKISSNDDQ